MKDRIRIAAFTLFATFLSCVVSCQYTYDFDLCGTIINSADDSPLEGATVQVFEFEIPFGTDLDTMIFLAKSTGDITDADGYYKVYFAGEAGGCRYSVGPSECDSLYVRVIKPGYESTIVGISTDEITREYAWGCHYIPPISITPGATTKQ